MESGTVADESLYSRVGGEPFFDDLVAAFYVGVADDEVLAPLYPEFPDFSGAHERLRDFLIQYFGGPMTYSERRGHPRLRMRHFPFHVGPLERDRWLTHMSAAVETTCNRHGIDVRTELLNYFVPVAEHLRNDTGLPITSATYPRSGSADASDS